MYFLWKYEIISIFYWTISYVLAQDDYSLISSEKVLEKQQNNKHLSLQTNDLKQNKSFGILIRLIAFGIRRTPNDDEEDADRDSSETGDQEVRSLLDNHFQDSENVQTQRNIQLLLLPLIIRTLLAKIAICANMTRSTTSVPNFNKMNEQSSINKLNNVYESMRKYPNITTVELTKIEKVTLMGFLIATFLVILFTIYSIKRRLQDLQKFRTIRLDTISIDRNKKHYEETKKLLP